jgi:hypothetical protein
MVSGNNEIIQNCSKEIMLRVKPKINLLKPSDNFTYYQA